VNPPYNSRRDYRYKRRCYYNALMHTRINKGWSVVHGIAKGEGGEIGHAWNAFDHEGELWAYDPTADVLMRFKDYAKAIGAREVVCYSPSEAEALMDCTGHTGPWDAKVSAAGHAHLFEKARPLTQQKAGGAF
jgi:hypothetical protein